MAPLESSRRKGTERLGVDEETIQRLHTYDWAQFNKERQYLQRQVEWSPYVDLVSAQDLELPVEDIESLLDSIEDMELLRILSNEDKLTLEIILYREIPANPFIQAQSKSRKLRVAAYCRVSTEQEEQESSFENQVEYYTNLIKSNPEWEFAGIFADRGISRT